MTTRLVSIVTPCFNEHGNVEDLYEQVKAVFAALPQYEYEMIFIDNASTDGTQDVLRRVAAEDHAVKVILNTRNFGQIRSPFHAFLQSHGDAVITMSSDLQDPPALIVDFLQKWEEGYEIVLGQKTASDESKLLYGIRTLYYRFVRRLADVDLLEHVTGFGLYAREVVEQFRTLDDPYPYMRGLISEFGHGIARIPYHQPKRHSGVTKNNFYTLYDLAMLGVTSHSKVPLRLATMMGFAGSMVSLLVGLVYLVYKLLYWSRISVGIAPLVVGLFFFVSVQLLFLGVVGEYVGAIYTQVLKRPLVT